MSERPICIARLQNQAKKRICQKPNFSWPVAAIPFQILVVATSQKLAKSGRTPSLGSMARAPAMKTMKIHGEQTSANLLSFSKPRTARAVNAAPRAIVIRTQPTLLGRTSDESRALDPERQADGRGRYRDHRPGQDAVEDGIGDVIDDHQPRAGDFSQVPVECEARPDGDRSADERPRQDGQQVPEEKSEEEVLGRDPVEDEERADDEFGRGDVLSGEQPGELRAGLEFIAQERAPGRIHRACPGARRLLKFFQPPIPPGEHRPCVLLPIFAVPL